MTPERSPLAGVDNFRDALHQLAISIATRNTASAAWWRDRLAHALTDSMAIAELHGSRLALRHAAGALLEMGIAMRADQTPLAIFRDTTTAPAEALPVVPLQEAIDDLITRTPVTLRDAARRTGQDIARLYSQGRVVAFVHATEQAVTDRVHAVLVQALREGLTEGDAVARIVEEAPGWTDAYARTAFRTNLNTAVTAGKFRTAQDPVVRAVIPAFMFSAVGDSDTRPNHMAANEHVWLVNNPVWNRLAPPLGYNCRCQPHAMSVPQLRRMGRLRPDGTVIESSVPAGAHPDEGFRHVGRPDLFMVGA